MVLVLDVSNLSPLAGNYFFKDFLPKFDSLLWFKRDQIVCCLNKYFCLVFEKSWEFLRYVVGTCDTKYSDVEQTSELAFSNQTFEILVS